MPNRKQVSLSQLHQFKHNPRVEDSTSDFDSIEKLYSLDNASANDLINLALEIADEGFDENEPIYAVPEADNDKEFQIYEGNRRLAALSLLANPDKYSGILEPKHLNSLRKAPKDKYRDVIEITIVDEEEAKKLMERNHGGVSNGTGRRPWTAEAQRNYARLNGNDNSFVGKITEYFEIKFGQPISGYIGGITTADRILNNKKIKKYIGEIANQKPTISQLEKVKKILDKAKEVSISEEGALTRVFAKQKDIDDKLLPALEVASTKNNGSTNNPTPEDEKSDSDSATNSGEKIHSKKDSDNEIPEDDSIIEFIGQKFYTGGILKYASSDILIKSPENVDINNTFSVLAEFWPAGISSTRKEKMLYLYAPVARGIFELSFGILKSNDSTHEKLSLKADSVIKGSQVKSIINVWRKDTDFLYYLVENNTKTFDSSLTMSNLLVGKDFCDQYNKSNPGAHTGQKHLNIVDVENIVNKAELFAILTQQYIKFLNN